MNGTLGNPESQAGQRGVNVVTPTRSAEVSDELKEMRAHQTVMLQSMTEMGSVMKTLASQPAKSGTSNKCKPTEGKLYVLAGWCHALGVAQIPQVWAEMFRCNKWGDQSDILNREVQKLADATNVVVSKTTLNRTEAFMKSVLSLEAPAEELSIENRHNGWDYHWYLPISET